MTEQEAWNDPEMKTILLLSGYARELGEGKDFETTTYETAKQIVKLFSIPDVIVPLCDHNWVDARNISVQSGKVCVKCHDVKA